MDSTNETTHTRRRRPKGAAAVAIGLAALLLGSGVAMATIPDSPAVSSARTTQTSQDPVQQVRALQTQVKALQGLVKQLQQRVSDLEDYNDCETAVPIGRYGDSSANPAFGYLWNDNGSQFLTTALDYVEACDFDPTYDDWFAVVDPSCVDVSARIPAARPIAK